MLSIGGGCSTTTNSHLTIIDAMSITTKQNTDKQLQRLAAQRQLYAAAKRVFFSQSILSGPAAVFFASAALILPTIKCYVALWGICLTLCDLFWLTPWQKRLRESAAGIQEAFDCDVLSLPWNDLRAGKRPDPELVKEQAQKYQRKAANMPPLTDWYASVVGELPLYVGRLACQRSNCWWDAKQRRHYAAWIISAAVVVFVAVLLLAIKQGSTIEDFILKVAVPLAPALLLGVRQFTEQREAASRLDKLKEHAERLWTDALNGRSEQEVAARSRQLQDEILENRKKSPLVFDAIYKRLQKRYESLMCHGVAELVEEAKQKLQLN